MEVSGTAFPVRVLLRRMRVSPMCAVRRVLVASGDQYGMFEPGLHQQIISLVHCPHGGELG